MRAAALKHSQVALIALALSVAASGCGSVTLQVAIDARSATCQRDFGVSTAASKVETFLSAVAELDRASEESDAAMRETCVALGRDAGMDTTSLARVMTRDTSALCTEVTDYLHAEQTAASVNGNVILQVRTPVCTWSTREARTCISECELRYRPDNVTLPCAPHGEPTCEGVLESPQAGPRCRAACGTRTALHATCSAPSAHLEGVVATGDARTARLASAWAAHGPRLALLAERAERLSAATERLIEIAPRLPEAAAVVSIRAVACASSAASLAVEIDARLASGVRVAATLRGMAH